jgi:hypothetical protein
MIYTLALIATNKSLNISASGVKSLGQLSPSLPHSLSVVLSNVTTQHVILLNAILLSLVLQSAECHCTCHSDKLHSAECHSA